MKKITPKLEPATFIIDSHLNITKTLGFLNTWHNQAIEQGKPLVVRINQKEDDRSKAQNRLYWMWMNQWAKRQGADKDSEHLYFKKQFLARIYVRDDVGQYRNTFAAVKVLKEQKHLMD
jgi:hypothetical protein